MHTNTYTASLSLQMVVRLDRMWQGFWPGSLICFKASCHISRDIFCIHEFLFEFIGHEIIEI